MEAIDTGKCKRRIDDLGRIVIPKEIRRTLKIRTDDALEIFFDRDAIIIKKYSPEIQVQRKSDLLLTPSYSTKGWNFSREEANER